MTCTMNKTNFISYVLAIQMQLNRRQKNQYFFFNIGEATRSQRVKAISGTK